MGHIVCIIEMKSHLDEENVNCKLFVGSSEGPGEEGWPLGES